MRGKFKGSMVLPRGTGDDGILALEATLGSRHYDYDCGCVGVRASAMVELFSDLSVGLPAGKTGSFITRAVVDTYCAGDPTESMRARRYQESVENGKEGLVRFFTTLMLSCIERTAGQQQPCSSSSVLDKPGPRCGASRDRADRAVGRRRLSDGRRVKQLSSWHCLAGELAG